MVHPYKWLMSELVPFAPFFSAILILLLKVLGWFIDLVARIDDKFRKAWHPCICRSGQRATSLDEFNAEVEGWSPLLLVVHLSP